MTRPLLVFVLVLAACGGADLEVGETRVNVMEGVVPWPDLPEALEAMQALEEVPGVVWRTDVMLYPEWYNIGEPGQKCLYHWTSGMIEIRVSEREETTADGCLPHEFAHRWQHMVDDWSSVLPNLHNERWRTMTSTLTNAAQQTFMHR